MALEDDPCIRYLSSIRITNFGIVQILLIIRYDEQLFELFQKEQRSILFLRSRVGGFVDIAVVVLLEQ